jgi:hypothetical protein
MATRVKLHPAQIPALEKAPTGIKGLDDITEGGLPRARTTIVCGGPVLPGRMVFQGRRDWLWRLQSGGWGKAFNSDAAIYGGDNVGNAGATLQVLEHRSMPLFQPTHSSYLKE